MQPLVANTDDLISLLDRVLDKGIVLESWARLSLQESGFGAQTPGVHPLQRFPSNRRPCTSATASAARGGKTWNWKIYFPSGGASSGANSPRASPEIAENRSVDFLVMWRYSAVTRERRAIQIYEEF